MQAATRHAVFLGDFIDRGPDNMEVIQFMRNAFLRPVLQLVSAPT